MIEAVFKKAPPCAGMAAAAARAHREQPIMLTVSWFQSASDKAWLDLRMETLALFTRMSMRPSCCMRPGQAGWI
jgi:hypothetical protein